MEQKTIQMTSDDNTIQSKSKQTMDSDSDDQTWGHWKPIEPEPKVEAVKAECNYDDEELIEVEVEVATGSEDEYDDDPTTSDSQKSCLPHGNPYFYPEAAHVQAARPHPSHAPAARPHPWRAFPAQQHPWHVTPARQQHWRVPLAPQRPRAVLLAPRRPRPVPLVPQRPRPVSLAQRHPWHVPPARQQPRHVPPPRKQYTQYVPPARQHPGHAAAQTHRPAPRHVISRIAQQVEPQHHHHPRSGMIWSFTCPCPTPG